MLELRLRSGEIVAFDGRILEVFGPTGRGERLHVAQLVPAVVEEDDGAASVAFGAAGVRVRFTREEAPARARLLAAVAEARRAYAELELVSRGNATAHAGRPSA